MTPARRSAAALVAVLLAVLVVPAADARPGSARTAAATPVAAPGDCKDTTGLPYATGLPALPCLRNPITGNTLFLDQGARFSPITQQAAVPKITFSFPETVFRVFYVLCSSNFPPSYPACPFPTNFPPADPTVALGYYGVFANAYVQSPEGASPQYGAFATVRVTSMGFGSIPVSADVTVRQRYDANGVVIPFSLAWLQSATPIAKGKTVPGYEQYGPAPGDQFFGPPALISGPVVVQVSNVTVDQVPLDVGSDCTTTTDLALTSPGGYYVSGAPERGKPGAYQPLFSGPSFLNGTVDIPAFSGCRGSTGEDVSALITGTISGGGNVVDVTQESSLQPFGCLADPKDRKCGTKHPATTYGP